MSIKCTLFLHCTAYCFIIILNRNIPPRQSVCKYLIDIVNIFKISNTNYTANSWSLIIFEKQTPFTLFNQTQRFKTNTKTLAFNVVFRHYMRYVSNSKSYRIRAYNCVFKTKCFI